MRNTILAQADELAAAACDAEALPADIAESDPDDMSQWPTTVLQNHILQNHLPGMHTRRRS